MKTLVIRAKVVGRRDLALSPVRLQCDIAGETALELLAAVVEQQISSFRARKQEAQLLQILSADAVVNGCDAGKIIPGGQDPDTRLPALADAIQAAMQAFDDGFFYMFVNDVQIGSLEQPIATGEDLDVLFLRLTPLVGG